MIIAIDGPAGSGKSTVARRLASELGLPFLDTGAMYRAVTLAALRSGIDVHDASACAALASGLHVEFDDSGRIRLNGELGEPAIRSAEVNAAVSIVAAHPGVRRALVPQQRRIAERAGAVAEGRDMGTVVFPDAQHKFFLVASPLERARRRALQEGRPEALGEVDGELARRDALDQGRAHSPLVAAADAQMIDTEGASVADVVARLLSVVRSAEGQD